MTNLRVALAASALLLVVGCGTEKQKDSQGSGSDRLSAKIKAGEQGGLDGGIDGTTETGTVTFTTTETVTQTGTAVATLTTTGSETSTGTEVVTSTETVTVTGTTTGTSTTTATAATTATNTTTSTDTSTDTATESQTQTSTASLTSTSTQTGTVTQTAYQTALQTITVAGTATDTTTFTVPAFETQTLTTSSTTTSTGTLSTVETSTQTYVLTGTVKTTNTATVSGVAWSKTRGRTVTTTTTQYLLGTASKVVTATVSSGTDTKTATAVLTGTGTASGTRTLTATATRTQGSIYYGSGTRTFTSTNTASGTGTQSWTFHPTGTLTQTATDTATQTLSYPATDTGTVTITMVSTAVITNTGTATLTLSVTDTLTNTTTLTNTNTLTLTSTVTNTSTLTSTVTITNTVTNTLTSTVTNTSTSTQTSAATHVETVTGTSTFTGTAPGTETVTSTVTATVTRTENVTSCQPGFTGPGVIDGSVILGETHQMSDLEGVWCITDTFGINYTSLTDLTGLESLAVVGRFVRITGNPALTSLHGLENLQSAESMEISYNSALTSLAALARLRHLTWGPFIQANLSLPACWAWEIGRQTNTTAFSQANLGIGTCGSLPEGFVCQPGASGPGVLDTDLIIDPWTADLRNYGGLTCVTGNVGISSSTMLTDLSGWETLEGIGGSLTIQSNTALTNVAALSNLKSVGGGLEISYNPVLTSLAGLTNLRSLGSNPRIAGNPALPACWGWEISRLTNRASDSCYGNRGTGSCGALPEGFVCAPGASGPGVLDRDVDIQSWVNDLADFGGVTCITGNLRISNATLTNLSGLETLVAIGGSLDIQYNTALTSVSGLDSLKSVGSALNVQYNSTLTSLAALGSLRSLGSNPTIQNNPALPACWAWEVARLTNTSNSACYGNRGSGNCGALPEGFVCQPGATGPGVLDRDLQIGSWGNDFNELGGLTCLTGSLGISDSSLTDVTGLVSLTAVGGSVTIQNNQHLAAVSGLVNLASVGGGLTISYNPALANLAGLAGLQTLGSDPTITNNIMLPTCWAQQIADQTSRTCVSCWGNYGSGSCGGSSDGTIDGPVSLVSPADIQRLAGVFHIKGDLTVASGGTLTDLVGLESLVQVDGNLMIAETSLASLQGLEHLTTVGRRVQIMGNYALTSLDGLAALASADEFYVSGNVALTRAAVPTLASVRAWNMNGNQNLPQCWPLVLEQRLGKGCSNCAYTNHGNGACPAPVDGWIDQTGYPEGGYIITFAGGGGAGSFMTMADARATYPDHVLAEPVYDGEVYALEASRYAVFFYTGWTECCHDTPEEPVNAYQPTLWLRVLP